ncbi:uncharacterized protein LOC126689682 [Quercus robur]|uniref:uncharacterized protein LOC126689682 n=1 Tax=Quercus robur TaxID=38942 RepID=UPI002161C056|nr:uncharacterized protein LOC126689682 [Quercus robur]
MYGYDGFMQNRMTVPDGSTRQRKNHQVDGYMTGTNLLKTFVRAKPSTLSEKSVEDEYLLITPTVTYPLLSSVDGAHKSALRSLVSLKRFAGKLRRRKGLGLSW